MSRLANRLAKAQRYRIETLALDIARHGFDAAVKYTKSALIDGNPALAELHLTAAIRTLEADSDAQVLKTPEADAALRAHCSALLADGRPLTPALRAFAAGAMLTGPIKGGRGKPSAITAWQKLIVIQVIVDMQNAGIPAYHGQGTDADAPFYATDAIAAAIGVSERTVREWWQKRGAG